MNCELSWLEYIPVERSDVPPEKPHEDKINVVVTVQEKVYPVFEPIEGTLNAGESETFDLKEDYKMIGYVVEIINDSETDDLKAYFNGNSDKIFTIKKTEQIAISQIEVTSITLRNESANPISYRIRVQGERA